MGKQKTHILKWSQLTYQENQFYMLTWALHNLQLMVRKLVSRLGHASSKTIPCTHMKKTEISWQTFPSDASRPISSFSSCKVRHFAINILPFLLWGVNWTAPRSSCNSLIFFSAASNSFWNFTKATQYQWKQIQLKSTRKPFSNYRIINDALKEFTREEQRMIGSSLLMSLKDQDGLWDSTRYYNWKYCFFYENKERTV